MRAEKLKAEIGKAEIRRSEAGGQPVGNGTSNIQHRTPNIQLGENKHLIRPAATFSPSDAEKGISPARKGSVPVPNPLCFTRFEFADALRVSVRTVDRMIAAREIRVCRVRGKAVRILREDVERYLNPTSNRQDAKAAEGVNGTNRTNGTNRK